LINDLYDFYFVDRKRQWLINALTLITGTVYSTIGVFILQRPEREVIWEAVLATSILLVCAPCVYVLSAGRSRQNLLEPDVTRGDVWDNISINLPKSADVVYGEIAAQERLYSKQALRRVMIQFWIGLTVSTACAILLVTGITMAMTEENRAIGVATAVGALVTSICVNLFFSRLDKANERVDRLHHELLESKWLASLLAATDQLSDVEKKDTAILQIIEAAASARLNISKERASKGRHQSKESPTRLAEAKVVK
jgi:hypothetical protein